MTHTPEDIKLAIANFPNLTEEQLVHNFKVMSSMTTKKEKDLYAPAMKAIEKERRKRGNIHTITSKPMVAKLPKEGQVNPDDYEAIEVEHDTN